MTIEFTEGLKDFDEVVEVYKKGRPIKVSVRLEAKQIRKLGDKKLRPGRKYRLILPFQDFSTQGLNNCILTKTFALMGDLKGFTYKIFCDLTTGNGHIKARKVL